MKRRWRRNEGALAFGCWLLEALAAGGRGGTAAPEAATSLAPAMTHHARDSVARDGHCASPAPAPEAAALHFSRARARGCDFSRARARGCRTRKNQ